MFGPLNPLSIAGQVANSMVGGEGAPALDISQKLLGQIDNAFTYHAPKEGQPEKYEAIRAEAGKLAKLIAHVAPESRELSLAITNLEQAVFWANAAIARG